jgi:hypothetical protein
MLIVCLGDSIILRRCLLIELLTLEASILIRILIFCLLLIFLWGKCAILYIECVYKNGYHSTGKIEPLSSGQVRFRYHCLIAIPGPCRVQIDVHYAKSQKLSSIANLNYEEIRKLQKLNCCWMLSSWQHLISTCFVVDYIDNERA